MMRKIIVAFLLLTLPACAVNNSGYKIAYRSPDSRIEIENVNVLYQVTEFEYADPKSENPSGSKTYNYSGKLTEEQSKELLDFIDKSGFLELKENYGAPEDQRFYPFEISYEKGTTKKQVKFRSNPSYEGAPKAFQEVERYLEQISKHVTQNKND